jgi:hypothetical protein
LNAFIFILIFPWNFRFWKIFNITKMHGLDISAFLGRRAADEQDDLDKLHNPPQSNIGPALLTAWEKETQEWEQATLETLKSYTERLAYTKPPL